MIHIKSPNREPIGASAIRAYRHKLFLAGAIDMGLAEHWQDMIASWLEEIPHLTIFNPRRDDWDSSWKQSESDPRFKYQVEWELEHINKSQTVVFYFPKDSKAPISFLELGLCLASNKKCFIYVHPEFYRKGNIDITCKQYNQLVYSDLNEFKTALFKNFIK